MKAIVVYESHWGNTAAIARAIAEGLGPEARAVHRRGHRRGGGQRRSDRCGRAAARLQPAHGKHAQGSGVKRRPGSDAARPLPSVDAFLDRRAAAGNGRVAVFETRIWWSPGSAAKSILGKLEAAGHHTAAKPQRFVVKGKYGPLREGELEKAKTGARSSPGG